MPEGRMRTVLLQAVEWPASKAVKPELFSIFPATKSSGPLVKLGNDASVDANQGFSARKAFKLNTGGEATFQFFVDVLREGFKMNRRSILTSIGMIGATIMLASPALAGATDPLFVNMTTDDSHRARMALNFSINQQKRGHQVTIFFNDKGVLVASTKNATSFSEQQTMVAEFQAAGGTVLVCPMCMKHYGVSEADLLPGAEVGNPEKTGEALFQDNGKTLTW
ncbi:DsrE family protein [Aestuariivirga sp.]|uniref:DsrE family protein n=1 Tax=Aestuariivirga sp. TaxID=2650926 RepID=UPI003593C7F3